MTRCLSVCLALFAIPAHAAMSRVLDEQPTIHAGIDAASAGDNVLVACGTYHEHAIVTKSGVILASDARSADCVTIDERQQRRAVCCEESGAAASIIGLTVTRGEVNGHAGRSTAK